MPQTEPFKVAIPIMGKMATRSFHMPHFQKALQRHDLSPVFLIPDHYFDLFPLPQGRYLPLHDGEYQAFIRNQKLLPHLMTLRRFLTPTQTADLLLREFLESRIVSEAPISRVLLHGFLLNTVRRLPGVGRVIELAGSVSLSHETSERSTWTNPGFTARLLRVWVLRDLRSKAYWQERRWHSIFQW